MEIAEVLLVLVALADDVDDGQDNAQNEYAKKYVRNHACGSCASNQPQCI
jgi:hypothetical protein